MRCTGIFMVSFINNNYSLAVWLIIEGWSRSTDVHVCIWRHSGVEVNKGTAFTGRSVTSKSAEVVVVKRVADKFLIRRSTTKIQDWNKRHIVCTVTCGSVTCTVMSSKKGVKGSGTGAVSRDASRKPSGNGGPFPLSLQQFIRVRFFSSLFFFIFKNCFLFSVQNFPLFFIFGPAFNSHIRAIVRRVPDARHACTHFSLLLNGR